jgi:hypothetical protein
VANPSAAESVALELLVDGGASIDELARELRLERSEMVLRLVDVATLTTVERLQLAGALARRAFLTADPEWSRLVAGYIWERSLRTFFARTLDVLTSADDPRPHDERMVALLLEECGPEVFEYTPPASAAANISGHSAS